MKYTICDVLYLFPILLIVFALPVHADDCVSNAPKCANANTRALKLLQQFPAPNGMSASAGSAYCAAKVGAEVSDFCASEFQSQGRTECVEPLRRQAAEYRRMASQNRAVMNETAARETDKVCIWER